MAHTLTIDRLVTILSGAIGAEGASYVLAPVRTEKQQATVGGGRTTVADRFYALADAMQKEIDDKFRERPEHTNRFAGIAQGMRQDGERLMKVQKALRGLARGHADGTIPPILRDQIEGKRGVEEIIDGYGRANTPVFDSAIRADLKPALIAYTGCDNPLADNETATEKKKKAEIRAEELAAARSGINGFFPTPPEIAQKAIEAAQLFDGCQLLEPSAGAGHLIDATIDYYEKQGWKQLKLNCFERNYTLCQILKKKGYPPECTDFLNVLPMEFKSGLPDRIVMNPPFESGQDAAHVMHAYKLLKPGGRMVAIMSEHPFFAMDSKARQFREWYEALPNRRDEKLPEGCFEKSDRPTGVNMRIVTIVKPEKG